MSNQANIINVEHGISLDQVDHINTAKPLEKW